MKSLCFVLSLVLLPLSLAFAQADAQKSSPPPDASKPVAQSDAQKSFDKLKALAGTWQGPVTTDPPQPGMGNGGFAQISLRVTSRGNALVHEMKEAETPDDPTRYDHPVTMLYLDGDRLLLTHYCDAGNRPRMVARTSADGKTVEFDFVDVAGGTQYGHMHHAVFTIVDANHHIEDWTYMMPGDKPVQAHLDLQRAK
jgi:phage tail protein X